VLSALNPVTSDVFYVMNPFGKPLPPLDLHAPQDRQSTEKETETSAQAKKQKKEAEEEKAEAKKESARTTDVEQDAAAKATETTSNRFSFKMLAPSQLPREGDLVAIDAEFVALSTEDRVGEKGAIVRPGQFG
jgi:hypothetical protein